jgi:hypothetical protein
MDRRKEKQLSSMVKKMVNGFIVGGTLGGVMYVLVESVFGDKIGQTPKNIIAWVGVIIGYAFAKVLLQ